MSGFCLNEFSDLMQHQSTRALTRGLRVYCHFWAIIWFWLFKLITRQNPHPDRGIAEIIPLYLPIVIPGACSCKSVRVLMMKVINPPPFFPNLFFYVINGGSTIESYNLKGILFKKKLHKSSGVFVQSVTIIQYLCL